MPENKDPNHKWHERLPNDLGGLSTEIVVSVDIPLTTHGPNLEDLVQWVHWQLTVDSWHIRRHPEYEDHQVALLQHHPEWSLSGAEIPTGVVNDKSHHVRLWFEHSVDWWTIHPWQKLHPKWVWEPPSHYFGLYLLLKKFLFLFWSSADATIYATVLDILSSLCQQMARNPCRVWWGQSQQKGNSGGEWAVSQICTWVSCCFTEDMSDLKKSKFLKLVK